MLPVLSRMAWAQAYPIRPVKLIVGFAAGGSVDLVARIIGQWLSERLGQQVFIENKPGAGTNIATETVVKAAADGYTLLFASPSNAINATLYDKLNFDFIRDIAPVAGIMRVPNLMEVSPSLPAATVNEFIAYAKANPGAVSYASPGNGTSVHMSAELFKAMTGTDLVNVTYRGFGAGGYTDLMSGRVQVTFDNLPGSIELVRAGKLRALAVTTATRSEALPSVPTVGDSVPGYEASAWYGIGAPRNTPSEMIERVNKEINAGLADPAMKARLADLGGIMLPGSSADFAKLIAAETEKWAKVIRAANIKPD
jgi:tripartite-type tricarboxylate transporter receptor subunit TctC